MSELLFENINFYPGCQACSLRNNIKIEPTGSNFPVFYFLGEAPGFDETVAKRQFVGRSGKRLRKTLYSIIDNDFEKEYIRWNNALKCRPPENRTPTKEEINCCKKYLIEDINKTKPMVIVTFGEVPLSTITDLDDVFVFAGRFITARVGGIDCYVYPMYHPSFLLRNEKSDKFYNEFFDACFRRLFTILPDLEPAKVENKEDITKNILVFLNEDEALSYMKDSLYGNLLAFDIETTTLRPFDKNAKIVSASVANSDVSISFPFTEKIRDFLIDFMKEKEIITHNLKFELEWFYNIYGSRVFDIKWHDTMIQAYLIDYRIPVMKNRKNNTFSLDALTYLNFGFHLKSVTDIDRKNITTFDKKTGIYNALDSKYTYKLYLKQKNLVEESVYNKTIEITKSVVMCQSKGLLIDEDLLNSLYKTYDRNLFKIENEARDLSEVKEFEETTGNKFNILSSQHISHILQDIMGIELKKTKKGNPVTDDEMLNILLEKGNSLAGLVLDYRNFNKLKSTYLENVKRLTINNIIYTNYNICFTATGRLSSGSDKEVVSTDSINFQNFPRGSDIKKVIKAPDDCYFVSCDYSQLEVRVVASLSRDESLCKSIIEGEDIHKKWSNIIIDFYKELSKHDFKEFRNFVKSALVFGSFYGSAKESVIRRFNFEYKVPEAVLEDVFDMFWGEYEGVKTWQRNLIEFYKHNGFIKSPTNRKWFAPLNERQVVNYIIQSTAAFDICAYAGSLLSKKSIELNKPQLQFILNIHDDLSFYLPKKSADDDLKIIADCMLVREWCDIVPLAVKISIGDRWGSTQEKYEATIKNGKIIFKEL